MRSRLLLLTALAFVTALLAFKIGPASKTTLAPTAKIQKKNVIRCGPDWEELKEWLEETDIPVIPGAGNYKVGSSRVDLQACKLEYSIVSPK